MVQITLPDGAKREYDGSVSPFEIAESISKSLAKKTLIAEVNGKLWDAKRPIERDADVRLITAKDPEGLEVIRHDAAHVLAQAVQELFPGTQVTIGPVIDDGFYYDFARDEPFSTEDFEAIEKKMAEIVDADYPIEREVWDRDDAIAHFKEIGEHYKSEIIADLPKGEEISIYRQGPWYDLCVGPHLPSTGKLPKAFKLMKVAGAYWRGDHRNAMLQRLYGTAWADDKQLKEHLTRLEEAEKRDHRRLGSQLNLFHMQEEAPGQVFWHPNGWTLYTSMQDYMRRKQRKYGYREINTPQVVNRKLWEQSGHWDKYQENMFIVEVDEDHAREKSINALKPMNCPCHVQVFNQGQKSYRDLPLRLAEFGACSRYEPSGALHGLMRVRGFTQDDGHIFCTEDQLESECAAFIRMLAEVYEEIGFDDFEIMFSTRPEKRVGSDESWDRVEAALEAAIKSTGRDFTLDPGEGAFYGPKLDFKLTDAIGRVWQLGTFQVDPNTPERLDASYIGEDGEKHRPLMLHRAVLGSFERFLGILIEHFGGAFPMWLAPTQVVVATISEQAAGYASEVAEQLKAAGLRVEVDLRSEKINYKVREHSVKKVPVIAVVGLKEAEDRTLALRRFGGGNKQEIGSLDDLTIQLRQEALAPDLRKNEAQLVA